MRWYKSAWLCAPVALIAFATLPAQTAPAAGADEAKVRAIVNSIYGKMGYKLPVGSRQSPDTAYSPSTDMLSKQYDALSKDEDISFVYNFDHFCECQDDADPHAARVISVVRVAPDLIDATAQHSEFDQTAKTRLRFQKNGSSWMLHDIFWSEGGSLRGLLAKEIARLTSQAKGGTAQGSAATQPSVAKPTVMPASVTAQPPVPQATVARQPASPAPAMAIPAVSACGDNSRCVEVSSFVANVTDVRESVIGNIGSPLRVMAVTVRFRNTTSGPLALGYVTGSGVVTDDRGNRYTTDYRRIRGIGEVGTGAIDPKFFLRPGESGDTRFEFMWQPMGALIGAHPVIDLAVREIESLPGNQWRLGREYALHFSDGSPPVVASAPAASAPAGAVPATAAATDACVKKQDCYSTGTFVAEITRMSTSQAGRFRDIQFSVRYQNLTAKPLVLGHTQWSMLLVDDVGNRYTPNWTAIAEVRGMGLVRGQQSDPSFVLQPGASREATYTVRFDAGSARVGSVYNVDYAVEELELLPANQVRSVRQYAVGFRDVKIGRWRGLRSLIDIRIGKQ